jgi:Vacuole effluxer Atg22 like.
MTSPGMLLLPPASVSVRTSVLRISGFLWENFNTSPMLSYISAAFQPQPDEGVQQRPPRYAGEDTTPTTRREILGWYSYGIAAEVFAVCGVGS